MLWLIQKDFYSKENHLRLLSILDYMRVDYKEINFSEFAKLREIDNGTDRIIVCGGMKLANIAKEMGWKPGTFITDDFDYKKWVEVYGTDMLNNDIQLGKLVYIEPKLNRFFIRPVEDSKFFAGKVITKDEFIEWRQVYIQEMKDKLNIEDIEVIIAPVNEVYSEYRCFVAYGNIVGVSQYKSGNSVFISDSIPLGCIEFVERKIQQWQPSNAFVIDIGYTKEGYKIVEFNNYTSSGFYACNIAKIVEALNREGVN